jgi:hypothetical protein
MTDREIIRSLFQGLELEGVEARDDFWCCNTCAVYAFAGKGVEEYVYFHEQETERAFDDAGYLRDVLYLGWAGERAARVTAEALRDRGYAVKVGGPAEKIEVRKETG